MYGFVELSAAIMQQEGVKILTPLLGHHQCQLSSSVHMNLLHKVDASRLWAQRGGRVYVRDQDPTCDLDVGPHIHPHPTSLGENKQHKEKKNHPPLSLKSLSSLRGAVLQSALTVVAVFSYLFHFHQCASAEPPCLLAQCVPCQFDWGWIQLKWLRWKALRQITTTLHFSHRNHLDYYCTALN